MLDINKLRQIEPKIIAIGSYRGIIQSILDFDFLAGKERPSVQAIIATGRRYERYFFGKKEVLIPVFGSVGDIPENIKDSTQFFLNLASGRRAFSAAQEVLAGLPYIMGGAIFAEGVPEGHALTFYNSIKEKEIFILGPASIGLLIPGVLKLGAIGGVDERQLIEARLFTPGSVAVFSASGGMTNEIINTVIQYGKRVSFSLAFGGERFPITSPKDAFLAAQADPQTETIVYFGELGGTDEYDIVELLTSGQVKKEVVCYIAGTIAEMFDTPPQFGHAKAMAAHQEETARGKREALRNAGARVAESYSEFLDMIKQTKSPRIQEEKEYSKLIEEMRDRSSALITTSISVDKDGQAHLLGKDLLTTVKENSYASLVMSLFLGRQIRSTEFATFVDFVLRLLVDHGPYVSGAVNTIITARAGRDLVSSLAAGLLTIGPRFGGAINQAADNWLTGVMEGKDPADFVEGFASRREYISGIGHKKYRVDLPDPRVAELKHFTDSLSHKRFTNFAFAVEKVTTAKKGNLILNVDGAIAAVLLDFLSEKEGFSDEKLQQLVESEFFNAIFVLSRSAGFIGHFLDQKRLDEGLFRLDASHVTSAE